MYWCIVELIHGVHGNGPSLRSGSDVDGVMGHDRIPEIFRIYKTRTGDEDRRDAPGNLPEMQRRWKRARYNTMGRKLAEDTSGSICDILAYRHFRCLRGSYVRMSVKLPSHIRELWEPAGRSGAWEPTHNNIFYVILFLIRNPNCIIVSCFPLQLHPIRP